ncbi:hypothetical protein ATPR_1751 [Acetobacter tropicalis NBRC 101654]|uniref:Uncharacterized protein n=1 Tax=Acetobacter tropicalis NBRC 101654 TaxID=749388 RepID=F7VEF2_9PROT|nr:hypothetical protein ATPR_1751 [Acetobacter tropicalis NBRC 101654]
MFLARRVGPETQRNAMTLQTAALYTPSAPPSYFAIFF